MPSRPGNTPSGPRAAPSRPGGTPYRLGRGLWTILATPFTATGEVDHDSMARQVDFAREAGADGLVALGVFGEAAALTLAEQRSVARIVAAQAQGMPLVLGMAGRSTAVAIEQATSALEGAGTPASLMVQVHSSDVDVVVTHLQAIHRATGAAVVLQDYPLVSGVRISASQILQVVGQCDFVAAIKAEAPPTAPAIARLVAGCDVPVFGGLGGVGLVDELAMGAAGAMTGFSHPEGLRATIDAFASGGFTAARAAWGPWLPLANFEGQLGIGLALRKALLHRRGVLDHPAVRLPAPGVPEELTGLLDQHLAAVPVTGGH
ncbi:dihydrodipicolinate synthase family protein [soil metagenome]